MFVVFYYFTVGFFSFLKLIILEKSKKKTLNPISFFRAGFPLIFRLPKEGQEGINSAHLFRLGHSAAANAFTTTAESSRVPRLRPNICLSAVPPELPRLIDSLHRRLGRVGEFMVHLVERRYLADVRDDTGSSLNLPSTLYQHHFPRTVRVRSLIRTNSSPYRLICSGDWIKHKYLLGYRCSNIST